MAEKLTKEQRQAVENRGGKLLVSAAAGSGKTKVLVERLMGYILSPADPANIDDFLIITYTKAAAAELRGKIAAKLSELIAENTANRHLQQQLQRLYLAKISTVHGFCTDILRQYAYQLDITADFRVADESECLLIQQKALEQVLETAYETADQNPNFCAFIDSQGLGRDDRQIPEIILKVYHSARCHLNPDSWLNWCTDITYDVSSDAGQTPWGAYLIADLKQHLSWHIAALERCISSARDVSEIEKPVVLFTAIVSQLKELLACQTWDEIVLKRQIDFGRLSFSKKCTDLQLTERMKAVRNACKDDLAKQLRNFTDFSAQLLTDMAFSTGTAKGLVELVRAFERTYDQMKRNRGVLDFSDLEHKTLDLLYGKNRAGITGIANEIGSRFREIMVDEYQDSNGIQDAIFNALTHKRQNCFMVGDVKQSIYQFRLADPGIFIEKYNTYTPAELAGDGEARKVLLSHNFRSSSGVIEAVNDVFSTCMSSAVGGLNYGEDEMLRQGMPHAPVDDPEIFLYGIDVEQDTYAEEASFVADQIASLLDGNHMIADKDGLRPVRPEDIVILLRSPGSVGCEFQYALSVRGIRCTTGDQDNLLQTEEIATVRAILQIILNPLQDIPLAAALTSPIFGYTADDLARLRSFDRRGNLFYLLNKVNNEKNESFLKTLAKLRDTSRLSSVTQLLSVIYAETNMLSIYGAMADGETKLTNLQSFFQIVSDFENTGPKELGRLVEFLDRAQERGLGSNSAVQNKGAVTIMSIHKSKGLEFPVVFLCGLSRSFNQESVRAQVLCDKDLGLGLGCVDRKLRVRYPTIAKRAVSTKIIRESVSEEMRVLYVAMTRAREQLYMTYAVKNLAADLQNIAQRIDMSGAQMLASGADCPGTWVILTALLLTEAGAFFGLAGKPDCTRVSKKPWQIKVVRVNAECINSSSDDTILKTAISQRVMDQISRSLHFSYSGAPATQTPSKLTATQLKGRALDTEIAEGTLDKKAVRFRKPNFGASGSGKEYGNTIHKVMQYIRFSECGDMERIRAEIQRMVQQNLIDSEQACRIDCSSILRFFTSEMGEKIRTSKNLLREFKFSILEDAEKYYTGTAGEKILLQGVVDCAVVEDDGIIILDFKTDRVTEATCLSVADQYKPQVLAYAQSISRIYKKPVKAAKLYFFSIDQFVDIL